MKRGDIVLIAFPFSDLKGVKVRPAVVVSSDKYNEENQDALFMLISSNVHKTRQSGYLVLDDHPDFDKTGLKRSSLIKVDKIVSLLQTAAKKKLGRLSEDIQGSLNKMLKEILAL